jgi:hypothetical protein
MSDAERQTRALHGGSFHGVCIKKMQQKQPQTIAKDMQK